MIDTQMKLAQKILGRLEAVDPHCILAGGAPMDWYLGNTAKDLDIYFYPGDRGTTSAVNRQLLSAFGEQLYNSRIEKHIDRIHEEDSVYATMHYIKRILDFEIDGVAVQLIEMRKPTFESVIPAFASDAVSCWWKSMSTGVKGTPYFYLSHEFKKITLNERYSKDHKYVKKLKSKLSNYSFCDKSKLDSMARDAFLRSLKEKTNGR